MRSLTLREIATIVGGELFGDGDIVVSGVSTDTRAICVGDLFAAIVGERVDAHDLAAQAISAGAVAVLGTRRVVEPCIVIPATTELDAVIIALGKLAAHERRGLTDVNVIGVTGSSGKTSTKDIIGQVLSHHGLTEAPAGSPNNELGMPLTLLHAPTATKNYVLEMGMRGLGHIAYLCNIAQPTIGVLTNVGLAHVGEVGSIENIAIAKSEIVTGLPADGYAILNADDFRVAAMAEKTSAHVLTYGLAVESDVRVSNVEIHNDGTSRFDLTFNDDSVSVQLPLLGEHNIANAAAAAAVGIAVGMSLAEIGTALATVSAKSKWRMEVHQLPNGITLINDAYNANPDSMRAAFSTLKAYAPRSTWAVIAGMHELGAESDREHAALGQLAAECGIDELVVVGELARPALETALNAGVQAVWFPEIEQASDYIGQKVAADNVLLFKASRSEGLERLAALVTDQIERGVQR